MKYEYPEAEFWISYMSKSEIAFLILCSQANKKTTYVSGKQTTVEMMMPTEILDMTVMGEDFQESSSHEAELCLGFEDQKVPYLWINGVVSGSTNRYVPGTHEDPPEGGESLVEDITIEEITVWKEDLSTTIDSKLLTEEKAPFTMKELHFLAEEALMQELPDYEDNRGVRNETKLSAEKALDVLRKKIQKVKSDHDREIRPRMIGKQVGI